MSSTHSVRVVACWLLAAFVAAAAPAVTGLHAQVRTTGSIVGTVKDASGAVVPDAQVEAQDVNTNNSLTVKSGKDGGFVFAALQPGTYRLLTTAEKFQPTVLDGISVTTGRTTDVTVNVEIGALSEEVRVQAGAPVIETTSSTISSTVRNAEIAKLPLLGRNVLDFALLVPGAAQASSGRNSQFNGLPGAAINITLDGVNNNSQRFRSGGTSFFTFAPVRLGAIEEVTVSTAGLTADAGAEGAAQIQFVTKRGTNAFHGQLFDQIRNDAFNANSVFNRARNIQKSKLRLNEFGGNLGGPIVHNKLFFFGNYEQIIQPSQLTRTATVLTAEAQQGIYRYVDTNGAQRTVNLLDIARNAGYPGAVDPFIAAQLQAINGTVGNGSLAANDLIRNDLRYQADNNPKNFYPTGRVDYQVAPNLSVRGVMNLQYRDLSLTPQFPGLPLVNDGFDSTYYIISTGSDWTIKPNLVNQISFGYQSNAETFNRRNTFDVYASRRVPYPTTTASPVGLGLTSPTPTNDVMPIPRNNPVYNVSDTLTLLKGNHTYTFGGTFRRTTMWESTWGAAAGGPAFNLGIVAADPVASALTASTIPGIRTADLPNALALYAYLTGRVSSISGVANIDEVSHEFGSNPVVRREAQNVGGLYIQDSWRMSPQFTLNYGFRWEFSGPAYNTNGIYTSPTYENLLGPSTAPFQPGTFSNITNPTIDLRTKPYKGDYVNPAPNVGFAWNPQKDQGFMHKLFGKGRSVLRGSFGVNYYDEGLINFQQTAGGNPGLTQQLSLNPGQPGFAPGGLTVGSAIPPLNVFPANLDFPISQSQFTFSRGFSSIDPDIQTPFILNWSIGLQRELWSNSAVEVRYVGNRGYHLWRAYDLNEVNIFENGFVDQFKIAQQNLAINTANGRTGFRNQGLPGQRDTPIFDAAFGARGGQASLAEATGYNNGTFITQLQQGQAGALATALAGNSTYLCRMVGNALSPCSTLGYNASGPYPINVFQANPYAAGSPATLLSDPSRSSYQSLQLQFRQRSTAGLTMTAHYTYGRANTDRFADSEASSANFYTLRDQRLNDGPSVYDIRHVFQSFFTYELPFGKGRHFDIENPILDQIAGGWNVSGILRLQSGRAFRLTSGRQTYNNRDAGVVLNGISVSDLQKMIKVRPGPNGSVYFVDENLVGADGRANPDFIQFPTTPGELGQYVYLYGPGYWNIDMGLAKRISTGRGMALNIEALFLNAFNHPTFLVGTAAAAAGTDVSINSTTFGQTTNLAGSPSSRNVQLRFQLSF
jgi:hypothetical protein